MEEEERLKQMAILSGRIAEAEEDLRKNARKIEQNEQTIGEVEQSMQQGKWLLEAMQTGWSGERAHQFYNQSSAGLFEAKRHIEHALYEEQEALQTQRKQLRVKQDQLQRTYAQLKTRGHESWD
ncbi:DUF3958 family protein [Numidum massiliense]|uniref:DUF3958 family protein n=1 Tax=Numidum massiliense TaxID=1522315 RepID=UPI0006D58EC0|nr:DUF3958 family protein [Numidum massiliense]